MYAAGDTNPTMDITDTSILNHSANTSLNGKRKLDSFIDCPPQPILASSGVKTAPVGTIPKGVVSFKSPVKTTPSIWYANGINGCNPP
jgi:hypothetical protein